MDRAVVPVSPTTVVPADPKPPPPKAHMTSGITQPPYQPVNGYQESSFTYPEPPVDYNENYPEDEPDRYMDIRPYDHLPRKQTMIMRP